MDRKTEIDRLFLAFFDRVAPLSSPMASTLRVIPRNKVRVINNFVDLDALPAPKSNRGKVVTYIGRLVGLKRVEDIIHAMTFIRDGDARLQIVGDGPLRRRYESLAQSLCLQDRIAFLGYRNDQLALLNESRILVLPSESEGISRAAMEGMALERVIIGTNIPGIRELVVDGMNGFLVNVGRPREIADRIDHVFSHPDEADRLAREGRLTIERSFSAAAAVRQYEHLYRELVP